jgi:hypothetical protein
MINGCKISDDMRVNRKKGRNFDVLFIPVYSTENLL